MDIVDGIIFDITIDILFIGAIKNLSPHLYKLSSLAKYISVIDVKNAQKGIITIE